MKQLIVNADDLGICRSTNVAIAEAYRHGILTSTSLMANGYAFDDAVAQVVRPNPGLGVGLHVCLTSGRSLLPPKEVPLLVDERGQFRHGFVSLLRLTLTRYRAAKEQIEREITAQFEAVQSQGVTIDHVDSHRHVHMIPAVFEIVVRLARRYQCPAVRVSHEVLPPLRTLLPTSQLKSLAGNLVKKSVLSTLAVGTRSRTGELITANRVVGVLNSGRMDLNALDSAISGLPDGVTEIITHPGSESPDIDGNASSTDRQFLVSPNRHVEFLALINRRLQELIDRSGRYLVTYSQLVAGDRPDVGASSRHLRKHGSISIESAPERTAGVRN